MELSGPGPYERALFLAQGLGVTPEILEWLLEQWDKYFREAVDTPAASEMMKSSLDVPAVAVGSYMSLLLHALSCWVLTQQP
ncbi:hypothetical protein C8Q76DRAFT_794887 [Earliella scabrosa]|nr:hypothetical protein C8Q76DRAFT_794887 [Earliella scabrosa]